VKRRESWITRHAKAQTMEGPGDLDTPEPYDSYGQQKEVSHIVEMDAVKYLGLSEMKT
jgi:hypothetical protein